MNDEIKEFNEEKYVEMLEDGKLYDYITNLQQENERLKEENINLREYISIGKKSIPNKYTHDKDFFEILDMPTYEDYKSRVENANKTLKNWEKLELDDLLVAIRETQKILNVKGSDE